MTPITKAFRWVELVVLFIGLPVVFYFNKLKLPKSIPLLVVFLIALLYLLASKSFSKKTFGFNGFSCWKTFGLRILISLLVISLLSFIFLPREQLFYLPLQNTKLWMLIMIFYPIWSAFTQEVIYRGFYFHRYLSLFKTEYHAIIINGILFGLLHIIFRNWIAVIGATIIGMVWASSYIKHRSILMVSVEHAIVGNYLFTIGLGYYFYVPDF
ncbi:MAG TPA: CPBP family intramembrane metalloprotease [Bacteroidales bacterium]|nr:CPBP family intramembrane metalloprotease [Bacteroidales bacterium]